MVTTVLRHNVLLNPPVIIAAYYLGTQVECCP